MVSAEDNKRLEDVETELAMLVSLARIGLNNDESYYGFYNAVFIRVEISEGTMTVGVNFEGQILDRGSLL